MNTTAFSVLKLHPGLLNNLSTLGYNEMTPIQAQSLPHILEDRDVIAQAKTGSGKTAAFGLGLLEKLKVKNFRVQSLVLCPTRELADQVAKELRKLAQAIHNIKVLTLCGGMPFGPQVGSLERGAHIIVGTPGRIQEHLNKGTLILTDVTRLVLDEADRMLDMGFQEVLDSIIDRVPAQRQTLLFSATYPEQIKSIVRKIMTRPVMVQVESIHDKGTIQQYFYKIEDKDERATALRLLLMEFKPESALVFCNTKLEVEEVADELFRHGFSVLALHGDMDQKARNQILVRFSNKSISILVATDLAARGLDIDNLDTIINYRIARNSEVHVHRIGRTGRAGSTGIALTLFQEKERRKITNLEEMLNQTFRIETLPPSKLLEAKTYQSLMETLEIDGGKKQKVRPGDILGALTGEKTIAGKEVGRIDIFDSCSYVAVHHKVAKKALKKLEEGKLKGRQFRARLIQGQ